MPYIWIYLNWNQNSISLCFHSQWLWLSIDFCCFYNHIFLCLPQFFFVAFLHEEIMNVYCCSLVGSVDWLQCRWFRVLPSIQVIRSPQCRLNLTRAHILAFRRTEKERNKSPQETACLLLHLLCAGRDVTLTVIVSLVSLL